MSWTADFRQAGPDTCERTWVVLAAHLNGKNAYLRSSRTLFLPFSRADVGEEPGTRLCKPMQAHASLCCQLGSDAPHAPGDSCKSTRDNQNNTAGFTLHVCPVFQTPQISKLLGARVVAVVSSPEKAAFLKQQGADEVIDSSTATSTSPLASLIKQAAPKGGCASSGDQPCIRSFLDAVIRFFSPLGVEVAGVLFAGCLRETTFITEAANKTHRQLFVGASISRSHISWLWFDMTHNWRNHIFSRSHRMRKST